jgi:hypothetical protein
MRRWAGLAEGPRVCASRAGGLALQTALVFVPHAPVGWPCRRPSCLCLTRRWAGLADGPRVCPSCAGGLALQLTSRADSAPLRCRAGSPAQRQRAEARHAKRGHGWPVLCEAMARFA